MQDPAVSHLVNVLLADQRARYSGPVERFLERLSSSAGKKAWEDWKSNEVTRTFLDAMKALSETSTAGVSPDSTGITMAFGVTSGINLAVRLLEDPSRVFPGIFDGEEIIKSRKVAAATATVEETYETPNPAETQATQEA